MATVINNVVWIDEDDDLYNEIRFASGCHIGEPPNYTVGLDRHIVEINIPDSVIASQLAAKRTVLTRFYCSVEIRLVSLVLDPDATIGRWIGTFSVETE